MTMTDKKIIRLLLVVVFVALVIGFFVFDLQQYLSFDYLRTQHEQFRNYQQQHPILTAVFYFAIYVLVTALSLPGALVMTVAGGAIFGVIYGTILVSFASTIGATLAFLAARFVLQDFVQKRFAEKLKAINAGMDNNGIFYLFTLRLVPIFPFFMINMVMGLTKIKTLHFFVVSQVAMFLGTVLYVNAGSQIAQLDSLAGILSWQLLLSFTLLGIFPLIAKKIVDLVNARRIYRPFTRPRSYDYNLIVIGGGAAGLVSSYIGATVKAKTLLIEQHKMGGDCLNTGCVPSKALIKSAQIASLAKQADKYGFEEIAVRFDFAKVMQRVQQVIAKVEPHDSVERYQSLGVDCLSGKAQIISPFAVRLADRTLTTRNIIVASGARPYVPEFAGLQEVSYYTADTIWQLQELPKRLLVLGGGPIGCELAQAFSRLGAQVTQVQASSRLLPREDTDVAEFITNVFRDEGITVLTDHRAISFAQNDQGESYAVCQHDGQEKRLVFDAVLLALGRQATTDVCGDELELATTASGTLQVNDYLQTSYPNIYACGDVVGPYQFTHVAAHQAWYCAINSLFAPVKFKVDYRVIPWCTFTDPEIAHVGLNVSEADRQGLDYRVTRYGIDDLDRAIADSDDRGFVKVLTSKRGDKILGATIVGARAGEIISEFVTAMKHKRGLNEILATIHIYPTFSESNKYVAGNWKKATAPQNVLRWLAKWHNYRRS